jgi:hypothetical protein
MKYVVFLGAFLFVVTPCISKTWTVDDDGPASFSNIQDAINAAKNYDTVVVKPGTYTGTGNYNISFKGKPITICSAEGPESTIVDCQEQGRGFIFASGEWRKSVLDGFTIKNGYIANDHGGGIYCKKTSPVIMNCHLIENKALDLDPSFMAFGGGLYVRSGSPRIVNCKFINNEGGWGGGLGIVLYSKAKVVNCEFIGNKAAHLGGGIFNSGENDTLAVNCSFFDNVAKRSHSILNNSSDIRLDNCVISNCIRLMETGSFTMNNCTLVKYAIVRNEATKIYAKNCIIWGASNKFVDTFPYMVSVKYSNVKGGWTGPGNIEQEPLFVDPDNNDYRLCINSPCIDAGNNNLLPLDSGDIDFDGKPHRIAALGC